MWTKAFAAVLLVVVLLVAFSATRDTPVREALLPEPSAAEGALGRVLPEVEIVDLPLEEALKRLEALSGTKLLAEWEELRKPVQPYETRFVTPVSRVTLRARDIRLSDALSSILAQLAGEGGFEPRGAAVAITGQRALVNSSFQRRRQAVAVCRHAVLLLHFHGQKATPPRAEDRAKPPAGRLK